MKESRTNTKRLVVFAEGKWNEEEKAQWMTIHLGLVYEQLPRGGWSMLTKKSTLGTNNNKAQKFTESESVRSRRVTGVAPVSKWHWWIVVC